MDVGARNAAEKNISENGDLSSFEGSEFLLHREGVEEGLGGVFVGAVARVYDRNIDDLAQVEWGACATVTNDDEIDVERLDNECGVSQAFTLHEAACSFFDEGDVSTEAFRGDFKGNSGPRARFNEEVQNGFAA